MTRSHTVDFEARRAAPVAVGRFPDHCEGYFACDAPGYLLGISLKIGRVPCGLVCPGSTLLDEINAFDAAEVDGANMGQLNVITVSSFCGPQGTIWGYDVCAPAEGHTRLGTVQRGDESAEVYDLSSLTRAFAGLMGDLDAPRFPFMPGSHVPAAMKAPVMAYMAVITAMVALAAGTVALHGNAYILLGAVSFYLSDLSVARDRFVVTAFSNKLWGWPLYFGAQIVLAATVAR
jgi:hypothetical protein